MSLLNFDSAEPKHKAGKKPLRLLLGLGALAGALVLGPTLAANLVLNTGTPVEFGQGVAQATACDDEVLITPYSKFVNSDGSGAFSFSSVTLSNINSDDEHCNGKQFETTAYGSGNSPLELYSGSTSMIVCSLGTSFRSYSSINYPVTSSDGNSFKATISVPTATADNVERILVESSDETCSSGALRPQTYTEEVEVPSGAEAEIVVNNLLDTDIAATGFPGTVRAIVSVTCGTIRITETTGLDSVYGYQSPLNLAASSIAFEGNTSSVDAALDSLVYNRSDCNGEQELTGSIAESSSGSPLAYNPDNFHYYQFISSDFSWQDAFNDITGSTLGGENGDPTGDYNPNRSYSECSYKFNGMCGYMATITSDAENYFIGLKAGESNVWLGGTDRRQFGTWKWEDDRAPEYNKTIEVSDESTCAAVTGEYSHWDSGEPNSYECDGSIPTYSYETALQTINGDNPRWNNLQEFESAIDGGEDYGVSGYIVEYGGSPVDIGPITKPKRHNITLRLL